MHGATDIIGARSNAADARARDAFAHAQFNCSFRKPGPNIHTETQRTNTHIPRQRECKYNSVATLPTMPMPDTPKRASGFAAATLSLSLAALHHPLIPSLAPWLCTARRCAVCSTLPAARVLGAYKLLILSSN